MEETERGERRGGSEQGRRKEGGMEDLSSYVNATHLWNIEKFALVWLDQLTPEERPQLLNHKRTSVNEYQAGKRLVCI